MRKYLVSALLVGTALVSAACSSSSKVQSAANDKTTTTVKRQASTIPADAAFNAADVTFAQSMIPHHAQAVEMADMALKQSSSPQVKDLANRIKAAQGPEIQVMTTWLKGWRQKVPDTKMSMSGDMGGTSMGGTSMGGTSMGGMSMGGMMSSADMKEMSAMTGNAFDRMFLSMMVTHHQGAVTMARTELADGKFPAATQLAQVIIDAQNAEIAEMKQIQATLPPA